ncbi:Cytochrome P450 family protein [Quillaja saponaria]|uniref:Cytochrome P450 family protein n=1 Tax=Quillaja saponaria TaxID=32244 RepID=A0AAD7PH62_QUISA|nr:Cytochrome P450 family protein [Quillaja saponaria]
MPEKGVSSPRAKQWVPRSSPLLQWRFGFLTAFVFVGMVVVWSIDGCTIKSFIEAWRFRQDYLTMKVPPSNLTHSHQNLTLLASYIPLNVTQNQTNETQLDSFSPISLNLQPGHNRPVSVKKSSSLSAKLDWNPIQPAVQRSWDWISAELEPNLTSNLLARWLAPGGEPCRDSKTVGIAIPRLDGGNLTELSAGDVHEFAFQALDDHRKPRCLGGDYFETDLSGDSWKSRPLVKDFGNGSYSISLQVHPDFTGEYNLTVILLYRHFEGLKFTPWKFVYDRVLRNISLRFYKNRAWLPELKMCNKSDFSKDVWSGRWTRHGKNEDCQISNDGRYLCLAPDFPCKAPWCNGSLGLLESNGWVYSTHCSFRIYSADSAWNCLKNRWIFFWGDSNHVDTIRNILNFILILPEIHSVPRRFDMNFSNPKDPSQSVRITSIFNGHWNEMQNYLGLDSLKDEGFQNLLKTYFSGDTIPDTMILNSGLHDGVHWPNIRRFAAGAEHAASFWADVMKTVKHRGLAWPKVFYRTTVATGGYARTLAFNPNKMEVFNGVFLEKLRQAGVVSGVIDNFDMTFPWHFDNRCNDGVHYGRAPAKMKWKDGQIGHQYFVDLMLAHVLLNSACVT